jgi:hypothetical protein
MQLGCSPAEIILGYEILTARTLFRASAYHKVRQKEGKARFEEGFTYEHRKSGHLCGH